MKNQAIVRLGSLAALVLAACDGAAPASPFDALLKQIPSDANSVMAVDVQGLFRSKLGVEKKWQQKVDNDFRSGLINTPPTALRFVVGMSYDYATLQPRWRVKVNQLSKDASPQRIAQRMGGTQDTVGGLPVVVCPRDQLIVCYSPTEVGDIMGVQRQELARWLRTGARSARPSLTPYLQGVVDSVQGTTQVAMAFDLEDVFHSQGLQEKFRTCKSLAGTNVDMDKLVKTIEGLKGAQVRMMVADEINAEMCLDFAAPPTVLAAVGKGLVLEALDHIGAELEEFKSWHPAVEGNRFVLRGQLAPASARLLLSVMDNRNSQHALLDSQAQPSARLDAQGLATVEYFRSISSLLADIEPGASKGNSTDKRTFYYKQYAEKIDSLPILNVDPQILQYGQAISITLRNLSALSRSTKAQYENNMAQYRQGFAMNTYGGYSGYGGAYGSGYSGWSYSAYTPSAVNVDNFMDVRNMMASTAQTSQALREQTWANIKTTTQNVRRALVEKYKVEI